MNRTGLAALGALAVAAAVVGTTVALTAPAGADDGMPAPAPSVAIGPTATIHARGAELTVPTTAVCAGGGQVYVQVDQVHDGITVTGTDYVNFSCTNGVNQVKLHVQPWRSPFLPGTAHVRASLYSGTAPGPQPPVTTESDVTVVAG